MVLTNFECWANTSNSELTTNPMYNTTKLLSTASNNKNVPGYYHSQNVIDLFNPSIVRDCIDYDSMNCNKNQSSSMSTKDSNIGNSTNSNNFNVDHNNNRNVSHLSSNGYYGFAPLSIAASSPSSSLDMQQRISSDTREMMNTTTAITAILTPMTIQNFQNTSRVHTNMNSSPTENYKNYCIERRKRYLTQDNDDNTMNNHYQNVKRFRSCGQQQNFYENQGHLSLTFNSAINNNNNAENMNTIMECENVNDYAKMFSNSTSSLVSSSLMTNGNHPFQNVNNSMTINAVATPSSNFVATRNVLDSSSSCASLKSNFHNAKYMDINRCMTSHMI